MKHDFTTNDLVRYLYKETNAAETLAICEALHEDFLLKEEYEMLAQSKRHLPMVEFMPSKACIQNILGYSQQATLETQY